MGYISTILAAILCAGAPLAAAEVQNEQIEQSVPTFQLGKEKVTKVRKGYSKGEYSKFLKAMDEDYKKADLTGLAETRQKQIPASFQEQWEAKFSTLQKQRNAALLASVSDKDGSEFAEKVRSASANVSTDAQEKALSKLNSFISMAPNSGANEDENTLIALDLEYEYKILHAQMPYSDISPEQMQEHQLALRMEKMDKMVKASKSFKDHSLKQAVGLSASNLDERLARNIDGMELNALVRNGVAASNETEEKVYSILSSYQGQFSDLMKEIDTANR